MTFQSCDTIGICCCVMLAASSMAPLYLLGWTIGTKYDVILGHAMLMAQEHDMTPMTLSIVPFCLVGQDDTNEMQHNHFSHVTPLALTSYDSNGI